jgi:hypothetical protein
MTLPIIAMAKLSFCEERAVGERVKGADAADASSQSMSE